MPCTSASDIRSDKSISYNTSARVFRDGIGEYLPAYFGRLVEFAAGEFGGHEFQIGKMSRIIVGIFISVGLSQFLHQLGRSVSEI